VANEAVLNKIQQKMLKKPPYPFLISSFVVASAIKKALYKKRKKKKKEENCEIFILTFSRKIVDVFVAFLWDGHFNMQILLFLCSIRIYVDPAFYRAAPFR
jgi:hypothetical protein